MAAGRTRVDSIDPYSSRNRDLSAREAGIKSDEKAFAGLIFSEVIQWPK